MKGSCLFKTGPPRSKLNELLVRAVIVTHALVKLRDLSHFLIGQREIKNIQIVPDMIDVPASGDDGRPSLSAFLRILKELYASAVAFPL